MATAKLAMKRGAEKTFWGIQNKEEDETEIIFCRGVSGDMRSKTRSCHRSSFPAPFTVAVDRRFKVKSPHEQSGHHHHAGD